MTTSTSAELQSFVLLTLGTKRFALPAEEVVELIGPQRVHRFPHTTPLLAGVLVRRGRIVPVCDVAKVLLGPDAPIREFYLIARRKFGSASEWVALPVTGECELLTGVPFPATEEQPGYVSGLLRLNEQTVEVLALEQVISSNADKPAERHTETSVQTHP
jgi:chemotaxis signal transduction protein